MATDASRRAGAALAAARGALDIIQLLARLHGLMRYEGRWRRQVWDNCPDIA